MEQNQGGFDRDQLRDVQNWRRSRSDRMLGGVCGGIGRALNIDPVLVRVVMAVLVLSGPGLFFYVAAWLLMPDEGSNRSAMQALLGDRIRTDHPWLWPVVIGLCVFTAIAVMSSFDVGKLIPGPIVVLGLLWLFVFRRKNNRRRQHWTQQPWVGQNVPGPGATWPGQQAPGTTNPPRPQDTPAPGSHGAAGMQGAAGPQGGFGAQGPTAYGAAAYGGSSAAYSAPTGPSSQTGPSTPPTGPSSSATQRPQDRTVAPVQPVWTEDDPLGLYVDEPPTASPQPKPEPAAPPVKGARGVKSAIVALTGIALAIAWLAHAPTPLVFAVGLITLGVGMLVGGFIGKTLALLPIGILLAIGVAVSTVFPHMPRDFVDTNYTAVAGSTITATNTVYQFDAGSVKLDLTQAKFAPGAKIVINGGLGEVQIIVPQNTDVTGNVTAKAGEVITFDQHRGGNPINVQLDDKGADGKPGPESVALDVHMKLGSITVSRG